LVFKAGNEFRYFDVQNVRVQNEKIFKIEANDKYNFFVNIEKKRRLYFFNKDINGKYIINNYLGSNSNEDADYVVVKFYLSIFLIQIVSYLFSETYRMEILVKIFN
jgi:hypothetical protein